MLTSDERNTKIRPLTWAPSSFSTGTRVGAPARPLLLRAYSTVNGVTTSGQTFQCSFNKSGKHVVSWTHSAPKGCPADVSEADRYLYPDCE